MIQEKSKEPPDRNNESSSFIWGGYNGGVFEKNLNDVYEKIVFWRKIICLLPTGKAGKSFIDETSRLLNEWITDSPLKNIAFKAIMVMPCLLLQNSLQKQSKNSKSKNHTTALERRMSLWNKGELLKLLN